MRSSVSLDNTIQTNQELGVGVKTGVSRNYRKLIRLRRMEDNGHYHYFFNGLYYCPLSSFNPNRS